jgi:predicted regulator of Ras-like GTPase activity (Roadblock/LC7/MglB family)
VQALLRQLNAVPGVVGTMVCDQDGRLLAHAFPPMFDLARIERAAAALGERTAAMQTALGPVDTIDFRYANSRVVVKAVGGARMLFLCSPSINLQLLAMSASGVLRQMSKIESAAPVQERAAPVNSQLYQAVQAVEELIEQSGGDGVKLRGQIALKAGFTLDLVDADTPDDPAKLQSLRAAVVAILGEEI